MFRVLASGRMALGEECCTYIPTELSRIFYVAKNIQETENDEIR